MKQSIDVNEIVKIFALEFLTRQEKFKKLHHFVKKRKMLHFQKEYSFLVKYFKTINTFGQNLLEQTSFKLQTSS